MDRIVMGIIVAIVIVVGIVVLFSSMVDDLNRPSSRRYDSDADIDGNWGFGDWGDDDGDWD